MFYEVSCKDENRGSSSHSEAFIIGYMSSLKIIEVFIRFLSVEGLLLFTLCKTMFTKVLVKSGQKVCN